MFTMMFKPCLVLNQILILFVLSSIMVNIVVFLTPSPNLYHTPTCLHPFIFFSTSVSSIVILKSIQETPIPSWKTDMEADRGNLKMVLRLQKVLYGLRQSPQLGLVIQLSDFGEHCYQLLSLIF